MMKHIWASTLLCLAVSTHSVAEENKPVILDLPDDCSILTSEVAEKIYDIVLCSRDNLPTDMDFLEEWKFWISTFWELTQVIVKDIEAKNPPDLEVGQAYPLSEVYPWFDWVGEAWILLDEEGEYCFIYQEWFYGLKEKTSNHDCYSSFDFSIQMEGIYCHQEFSKEDLGIANGSQCINVSDKWRFIPEDSEIIDWEILFEQQSGMLCVTERQRI